MARLRFTERGARGAGKRQETEDKLEDKGKERCSMRTTSVPPYEYLHPRCATRTSYSRRFYSACVGNDEGDRKESTVYEY